jgi:hypothetical protein
MSLGFKKIVVGVKIFVYFFVILAFLPFLFIRSALEKIKPMRELVINRISEILIEMPDLQLEFEISVQDLRSMSNIQLLDLYEEIFTDQYL